MRQVLLTMRAVKNNSQYRPYFALSLSKAKRESKSAKKCANRNIYDLIWSLLNILCTIFLSSGNAGIRII